MKSIALFLTLVALVALCAGQGSFVGIFQDLSTTNCQLFIYSLEDEVLENFTLPISCDDSEGFLNLQVTDNIDSRLYVSLDRTTVYQISLATGQLESSWTFNATTMEGQITNLAYSTENQRLFVIFESSPFAVIDPTSNQVTFSPSGLILPTGTIYKNTAFEITEGPAGFFLTTYDLTTGATTKKMIQDFGSFSIDETRVVATCYDSDEDVLYTHLINYPNQAASLNNTKLVLIELGNVSATLFTVIPNPGGQRVTQLEPIVGSCNAQDNSYLFASFANPKALPTVAINLDDQNPLTFTDFNLRAITRHNEAVILSLGWITEN